ncbi:MAG: nitrate reductase, partial [Desulfobacterales bacterium]|nr:nitrate reductase [Desulfobacterales bacterium]
MVFDVLLIASLIICGLGIIYRVSTWFTREYGVLPSGATAGQRLLAAVGGVAGVLFSPKILILLKTFVLEAMLQLKLLRTDGLRWLAHILIFYGFMLLLIMHALESVVSQSLFEEYYSTLNPFFFLRNFFGFMVLAGLAVSITRRLIIKPPRVKTSGRDHYAILILAVIMISGILLEGMKISSYTEFERMVEDYAMMDDEDEIRALARYWEENYGVVAPADAGPFQEEDLEAGAEIHEMNCAECHSPPQSAFMGYATSKILSPVAIALDNAGGVEALWYIHILACFIGLAYLPFSKMFHIVATPISILVNAVMDETD